MKRIFTYSLTAAMALGASAAPSQPQTARPQLVVGIVVDQLRTDYLEYLRDLFGQKGFNRLMQKGPYIRDLDYRALVEDAPTATAILYTGASPADNGLTSAEIFSAESGKALPALHDPTAIGNFTSRTFSPVSLRLSTIGDEIAIDGIALGKIYAVATDPQQSVVMAGHAGNSALWLDEQSGNWCSTAYYRDFPPQISARNHRSPLSARIDTIRWRPLLPIARYPGLPAQKRAYEFSHTFPRSDRDVYRQFAASAPGNAEVTDVAIECLESQQLGRRGDAIDMLSIGYTAAPYKQVADGDFRFELEDSYVRLDHQIGRLLEAIDRGPGLENTYIFLASTGYYDDATPYDPRYRVPSGDISVKRMESLLNSYLSAKYGNGDYVDAIHRRQIYLNRRAIEQRGLRQEEVRDAAREFVVKMSGVASARTLGEILGDNSAASEALRLSTDPKTAGDIFLTFSPGWNVIDDSVYPSTTTPVRADAVMSPAMIMAPAVAPAVIDTPVDARRIAPTVASSLHIRSPNGADLKPLNLRIEEK